MFVAVNLPSAVYTVADRGLYEPPETLVGFVMADSSSSSLRGIEAAESTAGVRRRMTLGDGENRLTVVGISKFNGRLGKFIGQSICHSPSSGFFLESYILKSALNGYSGSLLQDSQTKKQADT